MPPLDLVVITYDHYDHLDYPTVRELAYLQRLEKSLAERGFGCGLLMITLSGAMTTLQTACEFPIRLAESGPAGSAVLASNLAEELGEDLAVSFDMGGTTAKICLVDDFQALHARTFEVARAYRFLKGSGYPLRIPVIEMVEIGAGGGSIATVDEMSRIAVGPESASASPGPACYGRTAAGGQRPAGVTRCSRRSPRRAIRGLRAWEPR